MRAVYTLLKRHFLLYNICPNRQQQPVGLVLVDIVLVDIVVSGRARTS